MKKVKILGGRNKIAKSIVFLTSAIFTFNMSMLGVFFVVKDAGAEIDGSCNCPLFSFCTDDQGYHGCLIEDSQGVYCKLCESCGDGVATMPPEECDNGAANHEEGSMNPVWDMDKGGGDRDYCSLECTIFHVPGTWCGDGVVQEQYEECDDGDDNGLVCNPDYGDSCEYCLNTCELAALDGGYCGDGEINGPEECEVNEDCGSGYMCDGCQCVEEEPECASSGEACSGELLAIEAYLDYIDIGSTTSETGHNLSGWTNEWVKPGWGGNYGGGSSDESFRLLMGESGDGCGEGYEGASFFLYTGDNNYADSVTFEHLDGAVDDSFDVLINGVKAGHYTGGQNSSETWVVSTYNFAPVSGCIKVSLVATEPDNQWCADWGQVAFSWAGLKGYSCEEQECDYSISGYKYNPLALMDMPGWTITLTDDCGIFIASTTTDSEGYYSFNNLCAGRYYVSEEIPFGWMQTKPIEDTGNDYFEVLLPCEQGQSHDFYNKPMICGHKYDSGNSNAPLEGWEINLAQTTGETCGEDGCMSAIAWIASTTTNADGEYCFEMGGDSQGLYQVSEELKDNWHADSGISQIVEFDGSEPVFADFYNYYEESQEQDGSIGGCKYEDMDVNEEGFDVSSKLGGWEIKLEQCESDEYSNCEIIATTTTETEENMDNFGCYEFTGLTAGFYKVSETTKDNWTQTYPANRLHLPYYKIQLLPGDDFNHEDFANYHESYCGDGTCNSGESCSSCEEDCGSCGGNGGPYCGDGECNGNERCNQCEEDCGSCGAVLPAATAGGGTSAPGPAVLGEEGAPNLAITKTAAQDFANAGDNIAYKINITNNGNLTAFDVNLSDILPKGFSFVDGGGKEKSWVIGDIAPGETKGVEYLVNIDESVAASIYANIAEVWAANADKISASADIEVRDVAVLAESGFDNGEYVLLIIIAGCLILSAQALKRKYLLE